MAQKFDKKIFSLYLLIKDFSFLLINFSQIIAALRNKRISKPFREKIMIVVTAVLGCSSCSWFHAKQAVSTGISEKEVKNMLNLQFNADASDFKMLGLLYSQHYAETNRNPDKEMTEKLFKFYGNKTANNILLIIRVIFFGNLSGNTFDAFLSRLKGNKAENSNVIFEFFFFLISAPIMLPILRLQRST